ncbi:hypothetical protein RIF29_25293 [Crotalaria pallida]|uniref:Uncharacterized protein n=1 Tax=Crotalaria pallida TaxID=3830 RepID=A0AAN9ERA5_CROPI
MSISTHPQPLHTWWRDCKKESQGVRMLLDSEMTRRIRGRSSIQNLGGGGCGGQVFRIQLCVPSTDWSSLGDSVSCDIGQTVFGSVRGQRRLESRVGNLGYLIKFGPICFWHGPGSGRVRKAWMKFGSKEPPPSTTTASSTITTYPSTTSQLRHTQLYSSDPTIPPYSILYSFMTPTVGSTSHRHCQQPRARIASTAASKPGISPSLPPALLWALTSLSLSARKLASTPALPSPSLTPHPASLPSAASSFD